MSMYVYVYIFVYIYVITVCVCSIYMSKYRPQSGRFFCMCPYMYISICSYYIHVNIIYIYNYIYVTETTNSCFQPQTIERNGSQQIFPQFHYALGAPGSKALRKTVLFLKQDHVFLIVPSTKSRKSNIYGWIFQCHDSRLFIWEGGVLNEIFSDPRHRKIIVYRAFWGHPFVKCEGFYI